MGVPSPTDAAPAYDDVMHMHSTTRFAPSGSSSSGYAAVPQDDVEFAAPEHVHSSTSPAPAAASSSEPESLAQTIAGVFRPKAHTHCEACDKQLEARERRAKDKHCCAMVAWTFIVMFICAMIFGIVLVDHVAKKR